MSTQNEPGEVAPETPKRAWYKRKLVWIPAVVFLGIAGVAAASGGGDGESPREPAAAAATTARDAGESRARTAKPKPAAPKPKPKPAAPKPEPPAPETIIGDGMHIVGTDIQPGTYRMTSDDSCYYARLSGFSGELDDIIANGLHSSGTSVVTIAASDAAFETNGCGEWTKIS